jgi:hypothetical protein
MILKLVVDTTNPISLIRVTVDKDTEQSLPEVRWNPPKSVTLLDIIILRRIVSFKFVRGSSAVRT